MRSLKKTYIFSLIVGTNFLIVQPFLRAPEGISNLFEHVGKGANTAVTSVKENRPLLTPKEIFDTITAPFKQKFTQEQLQKIQKALVAATPEEQVKFVSLFAKTKNFFKDQGTSFISNLPTIGIKAALPFLEGLLIPEKLQWMVPSINILNAAALPLLVNYYNGVKDDNYNFVDMVVTIALTSPHLINSLLLLAQQYNIDFSQGILKYTIPLLYLTGSFALTYLARLWGNIGIPADQQEPFNILGNLKTIFMNNQLPIGATIVAFLAPKLPFLSQFSVLPELVKKREEREEKPILENIGAIMDAKKPAIETAAYLTHFSFDVLQKGIEKNVEERINKETDPVKKAEMKKNKTAITKTILKSIATIKSLSSDIYSHFSGKELPMEFTGPPQINAEEIMEQLKKLAEEGGGEEETEEEAEEKIPAPEGAEAHHTIKPPWYYIIPSAKSVFGVPLQSQL